jgi:hypothetical protein
MRVRPTERGLKHPVDDIEGQIRANLQPTPDRWFRVPEIDPHHEAPRLCEPQPTQLWASRPCLFSRSDTEARQSASELSKVIELSSADDRVELAQQVSLAVVLAHARTVPPNVRPTAWARPGPPAGRTAGQRPCRQRRAAVVVRLAAADGPRELKRRIPMLALEHPVEARLKRARQPKTV